MPSAPADLPVESPAGIKAFSLSAPAGAGRGASQQRVSWAAHACLGKSPEPQHTCRCILCVRASCGHASAEPPHLALQRGLMARRPQQERCQRQTQQAQRKLPQVWRVQRPHRQRVGRHLQRPPLPHAPAAAAAQPPACRAAAQRPQQRRRLRPLGPAAAAGCLPARQHHPVPAHPRGRQLPALCRAAGCPCAPCLHGRTREEVCVCVCVCAGCVCARGGGVGGAEGDARLDHL